MPRRDRSEAARSQRNVGPRLPVSDSISGEQESRGSFEEAHVVWRVSRRRKDVNLAPGTQVESFASGDRHQSLLFDRKGRTVEGEQIGGRSPHALDEPRRIDEMSNPSGVNDDFAVGERSCEVPGAAGVIEVKVREEDVGGFDCAQRMPDDIIRCRRS